MYKYNAIGLVLRMIVGRGERIALPNKAARILVYPTGSRAGRVYVPQMRLCLLPGIPSTAIVPNLHKIRFLTLTEPY
jgi:hypothetical protein